MADINKLIQKASRLHHKGRLSEAAGLCKKLLAIAPDYTPALNMLGIISAQKGEFPAAINFFRKAIETAPNELSLRENMARAWLSMGDYAQAQHTYKQILAIKPDSYTALSGLGNALQYQRKYKEALPVLMKALEIHSRDPLLYLNIGGIYQQTGRPADAALQYRKALALAPRSADANACMGHISLQQKDYHSAKKYFSTAITLGAQRSDIESGLAQALEHEGDENGAREHYFRSVELDPDSQNAYIHLDRFLLSSGGTEKKAFLKQLGSDHIYSDWEESLQDLRKLASMYTYPDKAAVHALQKFMDDYKPGELHERDWWEKHLQAFGGINHCHDKLLRSLHSAVYCWSLPDRQTLTEVAEFVSGTRLRSYGAGSGVWERLLQQHYDVEVAASDINLRHRFLPMSREDYSNTTIEPSDTIFFAWILRGDLTVLNIFRQMKAGQKLILVGEPPDQNGIPRICATPEMWSLLEKEFTLVKTIRLVSYSLLNDTASFFIKNRE